MVQAGYRYRLPCSPWTLKDREAAGGCETHRSRSHTSGFPMATTRFSPRTKTSPQTVTCPNPRMPSEHSSRNGFFLPETTNKAKSVGRKHQHRGSRRVISNYDALEVDLHRSFHERDYSSAGRTRGPKNLDNGFGMEHEASRAKHARVRLLYRPG